VSIDIFYVTLGVCLLQVGNCWFKQFWGYFIKRYCLILKLVWLHDMKIWFENLLKLCYNLRTTWLNVRRCDKIGKVWNVKKWKKVQDVWVLNALSTFPTLLHTYRWSLFRWEQIGLEGFSPKHGSQFYKRCCLTNDQIYSSFFF